MSIINQLASKAKLSERELASFLFDAPLKYKHYSIPKRSTGRRLIAQPSQELKRIQRLFISLIDLSIHPCAMAYRQGVSIKDNAKAHMDNRYLLSMDLRNFFNSITPDMFWSVCKKQNVLMSAGDTERELITKLLFWSPTKNLSRRLVLSVGAPSSPLLSNFIMYDFDVQLARFCNEQGIVYTRYADDLSFSTNQQGVLFKVPEFVKQTLQNTYGNNLLINYRKTVFSSMAHNRHVTGITINNEGELSLGRERKRYIKGLVFRFVNNELDGDEREYLRGLLAFAHHIEPTFIDSLEKKYGAETVQMLVKRGAINE